MLKQLFLKYRHIVFYGIFGVLTTLINIGTYAVCYRYFHISNVISNVTAWILSVAFAFITNKIWVFGSRAAGVKAILNELWNFAASRLATGLLDLLVMYVAVDVMHGSPLAFKVISNVIVIVLNYVLSRLVVFRKNVTEE